MRTYLSIQDIEKHNPGIMDNITMEWTYHLVLIEMDGGNLGAYNTLFLCKLNRGIKDTVVISSESAETWGDVFLGSKEENDAKLKDLMFHRINEISQRYELAKSRPIIDLTRVDIKIEWN